MFDDDGLISDIIGALFDTFPILGIIGAVILIILALVYL